MRWMRGLAGVGMLAGCLEAKTVHCADGVVCPEGLACARAPVYCEAPARVEACAGADDFTTCTVDAVAGACRGGACFPCVDNELAGCARSGWFPMVSHTTANLNAVWTAGLGIAYAIGRDTIASYDGFGWKAEVVPGVVDFNGLWGSDPDHVFATTDNGEIYERTPDGSWALVHEGIQLTSISGSGPDDIIALSLLGTIVRSSGAGWAEQPVATGNLLNGISARSQDDVFIVGDRGVVHRSVGTTWPMSRPAATGQATLNAVAATPTVVFAIGAVDATATAVRLPAGASTWIKDVVSGVPDGEIFLGIWASPQNEAFAVGNNGRILRYADGWSIATSGTGTNLHAVHGTDGGNVFAVGAGGTILRYTGP